MWRFKLKSIWQPIRKSKILEVAEDGLEILIDGQLVETELLKQVPLVKTISAISSDYREFQLRKLKRRLIRFLQEGADQATEEQWVRFAKELEEQEGGAEKVGEILIDHLEALDRTEKAIYSARIFSAAARKEISVHSMHRMLMVLERSYVPDFKYIEKYQDDGNFVMHYGQDLMASLGIIEESIEDLEGGTLNSVKPRYRYVVTEFGKEILVAIGLSNNQFD